MAMKLSPDWPALMKTVNSLLPTDLLIVDAEGQRSLGLRLHGRDDSPTTTMLPEPNGGS